MGEQASIGPRLRSCRKGQGLTLKAMEARAGVSATHISEIERGKTSPTIGALAKIANALEKDVSFFLEEEALDDVCHLVVRNEIARPLPWHGGQIRRLTHLVPGARLCAYRVELDPSGPCSEEHHHEGNEVYFVESGRVRFIVGNASYDLAAGDSVHLRAGRTHRYLNIGPGEASMLFFTTRRHTL